VTPADVDVDRREHGGRNRGGPDQRRATAATDGGTFRRSPPIPSMGSVTCAEPLVTACYRMAGNARLTPFRDLSQLKKFGFGEIPSMGRNGPWKNWLCSVKFPRLFRPFRKLSFAILLSDLIKNGSFRRSWFRPKTGACC
jgi:hypothetical protein